MFQSPKRLLVVAAICGVVQFLSGAPQITESTGGLSPIIIWVGFGFGLAGVTALVFAIRAFVVSRSHAE